MEQRAANARAAAVTERATERHVDATLAAAGFNCLHDCRWPGRKNANIDHVVVGPTGIWVIDDKRFSHPVTLGKGRLWTGRWPLDRHIEKVTAQAAAVAHALGAPNASAVLSIHGAALPEARLELDGVHVAAAMRPTSELLLSSPTTLNVDEVATLTDRAVRALKPSAIGAPRSARGASVKQPTPPAPPDPVQPDQGKVQRRRRLGLGRRGRIAAGVLAILAVIGALTDPPQEQTRSAADLEATFACVQPGAGWMLTVAWDASATPGLVPVAAPSTDGPWEPLLLIGDGVGARSGRPPGEVLFVKLDGDSAPDRANLTTAPTDPC